jgi:glutaryl-CoA transferase
VAHRGMRLDLPHPSANGGTVPTVRSPIVIDGEAMVAGAPSPLLGEHTHEVLNDPQWGAA